MLLLVVELDDGAIGNAYERLVERFERENFVEKIARYVRR